MTAQEILDEMETLGAENKAIELKIMVIGTAGNIAGWIYGSRHGVAFWGKIGYALVAGFMVTAPANLFYANKLTQNQARIEQLKNM